jgi:hypothetical protein
LERRAALSHRPLLARAYHTLLSPRTKKASERVIIVVAIVSFVIHLILIGLAELNVLPVAPGTDLLADPIDAIYTPFSFILLFEVYALVYYIPRSTTFYIGKQYEIITLIVIRRIFKDLSNVDLTANWLSHEYNRQFLLDITTTALLFAAIFCFQWIYNPFRPAEPIGAMSDPLRRFIRRKKILATLLVPTFLALAIYSFTDWLYQTLGQAGGTVEPMQDINQIFFNEFFAILIVSDVLLLLLSLFNAESFHKIIRNSGFVISTIMIRLSFAATGLVNNALILGAVLFGVIILIIHNQFEKLQNRAEMERDSRES